LRSLGLRLYDRSKVFLRRAGTVILGVAIVLWVLLHLPLQDGKAPEITNSYAGMIGHTIEPVIKPLGFNWKIGIGLVSSIAAREVIVGTLGTIYGIEKTDQSEVGMVPFVGSAVAMNHGLGLGYALQSEMTTGGAIALLIFFAFAMQCMSTIAVVRRETGGWRWPAIQFVYMTLLAFMGGFVTNQIVGRML
jgi:ferrous iron transport protein B